MIQRPLPYGRQNVTDEDIEAVCSVLRSDWLTQGPRVQELEERLSQRFGAFHTTVVSNGTAALHLTALGLNWKPGDIVLTTPITFLASANCILYAGATPGFVDIDPVSYTLDPEKLEVQIRDLHSAGKSVKAVVAVDYAGHPCDWEGLRYLANRYEFQLVDDACHAIGATYQSVSLSACSYADAVIFSFHPVKHITSGEGGAILTNDQELDKRIKRLRMHGMTKDPLIMEETEEGPWYYEMHELGFNYRITDFQCTLALSQLKRLDWNISQRQSIADFYNQKFAGNERLSPPFVASNVSHAWHLYPLKFHFDQMSINKKELFQQLRTKNICVQVHYIPVHLQPYYRKNYGFKKGDFPHAEEFYQKEVSLPMFPNLSKKDMKYVADCVLELIA